MFEISRVDSILIMNKLYTLYLIYFSFNEKRKNLDERKRHTMRQNKRQRELPSFDVPKMNKLG